ncbi:MAG: ABC transporter substrate-binding protein, partial [Thermobifida fusca]|nr:ABC transporter substrate-binding protein [Thermobifida fusca]
LKFHDGSPLTAEDVVYTYKDVVANREFGTVWLSALAFMKDIKAVDDLTVEIQLTEPYAYMDSRLAMIPIISSETPYKVNDTYAQTENGAGPYKLEKFNRGDSIVLRRFDDYHGEQPPFETITFKVVPEPASRVARLTNGESHIAPGIPTDQVELVKSRGHNAKIVETNISRLFFYPSMKQGRPTANRDFRLALAWAIDRGAIVQQVYKGAARPNSTYLTYGMLYHDEELGLTFGDKPNLEKAREHLEKSGVKLDRKLSIIAFNSPDLMSAATIIQANFKELGIDATVEGQDVAAFYPKLVSGDYDLIMFSSPVTSAGGFAPDYVYGGLHSKSANNFNKFADPKMDELLHNALVAQIDEVRTEAWRKVQEYDVQTQGVIQIVISQVSEAWSKDLKNYEPSSLLWLNTLLDAR